MAMQISRTLSAHETQDWYYRALALAMRRIGVWSDSIRLGYARGFDSGEMMDRIYQNRASGRYAVGALLDWMYLHQVGCDALRGRKRLLKATLRAVIASQRGQGIAPVIVDIAAGPATYLVEALAEDGCCDVQTLCRDLDEHGLQRGRALAQRYRLTNIRYERGDALDEPSLLALAPQPTIVVASGFYEILLDDDLIRRSMRIVRSVLAPHGTFIFTTQVAHPQLKLIANVLVNRHGEPWLMKNRLITHAHGWAREAGFGDVRASLEAQSIFSVSVARP